MLADFNNSFTVRTRNYFYCNLIAVTYYLPSCYTIDELKQRLIEVWCGLEQSTVDMAIEQRRGRLRACVRAKGGHFEHSL